MRQSAIEITVGLFVLAGLTALLMMSLRVSGLSDIYTGNDVYEITADFENVGGLKPRARVALAGVSIGRVKKITFNKEAMNATVTMLIYKDVNTLPDDTQAQILTSGLLGDNYIALLPGQGDSAKQYLKPGSHLGIESTHKAVILEDLISKFLANTAMSK